MSDESTVFITRAEFQAAIARLDAADVELRSASISLERELRHDYEGKIADAVRSVGGAIESSHDNLHDDVEDVKEHLTWQDRVVGGGVVTGIVYALLHFLHLL